jgi:L-ornithine Nalpha-acyltransferase
LASAFATPAEAVSASLNRRLGRGGLGGFSPVVAESGTFELRLATTAKEVRQAQKLRYQVFFDEGSASPDPAARVLRRDFCRFDSVCDHLIVVDRKARRHSRSDSVVGVYRLLRQEVAARAFGFASAAEFEVAPLIERHLEMRFLELGRACVAPTYRGGRVLGLLWHGVWIYARHHRIDALIGCASLHGIDVAGHAAVIRALCGVDGDPSWQVAPRPERACPVAVVESDPVPDLGSVWRSLPPLIKGYKRLGAIFSLVPVVDYVFGTTDLFVALPLRNVNERYLNHFTTRIRGLFAT